MSSVTHELRTPLTSIRAFAELMRDDPQMDTAQRQQFLELVVAETERLSRLVNQVLDMAKIESGQAEWRNDAIDLRELIAHAVQTTAEVFRERGAEVRVEQLAQLPLLHADRDRLLQVLLNLLGNAAGFAPAAAAGPSSVCAARAARHRSRRQRPGSPRAGELVFFRQAAKPASARKAPAWARRSAARSSNIMAGCGCAARRRSATFGFELPWQHGETSA
jgi:signal transduction histidine kinase